MSDEITQAINMEVQGVQMAFKVAKYGLEGSIKLARLLASIIKFGGGKFAEKVENRKGERKVSSLMKMIQDNHDTPLLYDIPEDMVNELKEFANANKLHYACTLDFNPNDGLKPIMVPSSESELWSKFIEKCAQHKQEERDTLINTYKGQLKEVKEERKGLDKKLEGGLISKESYEQSSKDLDLQIDHLEQAINDAKSKLNYSSEGYSLNDYLMKAKDTDFENNPELGQVLQDNGVDYSIGEAKNIFMPVRNKMLVPEGNWCMYLPDQGVTVERNYVIDEKTNLVSSVYTFKDKNGQEHTYSDLGHTNESWKAIQAELFDKAGILEGSTVKVFTSSHELDSYKKITEKLMNADLQKETLDAMAEAMKDGMTTDVISDMYGVAAELKKNQNSRSIGKDAFSVTFDSKNITQQDGKIIVDLGNDNKFAFSNIYNGIANKDGTSTFTFDSKCNPSKIVNKDGKSDFIGLSMDEAVGMITKATNDTVIIPYNSQAKSK